MLRATLHLLGLISLLTAFPQLPPKLRLIFLPLAGLAALYLSVRPALHFIFYPLTIRIYHEGTKTRSKSQRA